MRIDGFKSPDEIKYHIISFSTTVNTPLYDASSTTGLEVETTMVYILAFGVAKKTWLRASSWNTVDYLPYRESPSANVRALLLTHLPRTTSA